MTQQEKKPAKDSTHISLFLCGDIMTGRGIDQVLPHPSDPRIYEPYMSSATGYVELAEIANGPIPKPVEYSYIWGDALTELERMAPDVRIINLETAVTTSNDFWPGKGINYRMHPKNIPCITAAKIDCCVLANNHVLDWGYSGLEETLNTLQSAHLKVCGAGENIKTAQAPAVVEVQEKGRVIIFSFGLECSGIDQEWAATPKKPGVNFLADLSEKTVRAISKRVGEVKQQNDIVVASLHWGGNWGYSLPERHITFAHNLIDEAGIDVIHGHSSHHPRAIEVYKGKPIIYGCGDLINDYEGISGYESFRDDLAVMYFVTVNVSTGRLVNFQMIPTQIKRFKVNSASRDDARWLADVLDREGKRRGTSVQLNKDNSMTLQWN